MNTIYTKKELNEKITSGWKLFTIPDNDCFSTVNNFDCLQFEREEGYSILLAPAVIVPAGFKSKKEAQNFLNKVALNDVCFLDIK
jgi:hypothetical protein